MFFPVNSLAEAFTSLSLTVSSCTFQASVQLLIGPLFFHDPFSHPATRSSSRLNSCAVVGHDPDLHLIQIPILSLELRDKERLERRGWNYSTACSWFSQGRALIHMAQSCQSGLWIRLVDIDGSVCMPGTYIWLHAVLSCSWCFLNAPLALCQSAKCNYSFSLASEKLDMLTWFLKYVMLDVLCWHLWVLTWLLLRY